MIDKFNFYDVYGYFLPGAAVLFLFWLPFGLTRNSWPASDWGSAILGVVLAYFAGHLLQIICTRAIPSKMVIDQSGPRNPSDFVLDSNTSYLSKEFKVNLAKLVETKLHLDLNIDQQSKDIDKVRNDAFFLARHVLVGAKEVSYAEQFQGMYTLTRGLTAAFALACANYIGWNISKLHRGWLDCFVIVIITVSLLAGDNFAAQLLRGHLDKPIRLERLSALVLLVAALGIGYGMGRRYGVTSTQVEELALCAMGALMASLRCYGAYKSFSITFAITVWRDFFASADKPPATKD